MARLDPEQQSQCGAESIERVDDVPGHYIQRLGML